ncbi:MAG: uroporphyrinogen-III C-methyltransferase [Planctomycetes bacterium]|uniref:uroporphyrinogen-III C-methyltransferase n=1 Tax=Eiseniibacteriota bacterium TaxID=2212470 RepID=A0A937XBM9_UNCEI|nr:uroporphyrinogen-III C-methyltransferase [Candidatus Eisenbacteria bacterium]MBM4026969.1 uroporphyrinogen-III C-methyltransferase [Planctomycetota bacterium]
MPEPIVRPGTVYLVGAGPGDPGLITVKGLQVLHRAQVVVYDRLVHPALLKEAPAAEHIFVGKQPGDPHVRQGEINALMIARARARLVVVRLKGGDPFVFGRGGEECEALLAAGVPFEVIPGVTAATAVPAAAGIPVTHRRHASAFAVITGHECPGRTDLDWEALARIPTLVVLMGLRTLPVVVGRLLEEGASPATPAAVVASGTLAEQRTVVGTLGTIAALVRQAGIGSPATLIVGDVVRLAERIGRAGPAQEVETVGAPT